MFVRVKVGIEKKNYLLTTKIRVFPELKHTQSLKRIVRKEPQST